MKTHRIAVIAGDGIGNEVMPEGVRILETVARRFDIDPAKVVQKRRLQPGRSASYRSICAPISWCCSSPIAIRWWR